MLNTEQTPRSGDLIKHTCLTTPVTSDIAPYVNIYLKQINQTGVDDQKFKERV